MPGKKYPSRYEIVYYRDDLKRGRLMPRKISRRPAVYCDADKVIEGWRTKATPGTTIGTWITGAGGIHNPRIGGHFAITGIAGSTRGGKPG